MQSDNDSFLPIVIFVTCWNKTHNHSRRKPCMYFHISSISLLFQPCHFFQRSHAIYDFLFIITWMLLIYSINFNSTLQRIIILTQISGTTLSEFPHVIFILYHSTSFVFNSIHSGWAFLINPSTIFFKTTPCLFKQSFYYPFLQHNPLHCKTHRHTHTPPSTYPLSPKQYLQFT